MLASIHPLGEPVPHHRWWLTATAHILASASGVAVGRGRRPLGNGGLARGPCRSGHPARAVTELSRYGLTVDLPRGWEGSVFRRTPGPGEQTHPILHAGSFPLPPDRGDYGNGAVQAMLG